MRPLAIALLVLALSFAALTRPAQRAAASNSSLPQSAGTPPSASPALLQPAPAIQSLIHALEGNWATHEKYEPLFMTPHGGIGTGMQIFRSGPGGFTLLENYHSKTPAGELFGTGIIWWDQTASQLQHLWCINVYPDGCEMFPPPPQPGPRWDGKTLSIHIVSDQAGKRMVWDEAISDITAASFTQTASIAEGDSPSHLWFTSHAVRRSQP
ncbi:MAG TPA: hypothetical protein VMH00_09840 [Candidatus Limnocylindrales bacterium]|nr:hypothetical protein [Candidatus Limnocylindrales bacterium]